MPPEGWDKSKVSFPIHIDPLWELRLAARETARKMWVVYREFVDAGFNEEQALDLTVNLTVKEE